MQVFINLFYFNLRLYEVLADGSIATISCVLSGSFVNKVYLKYLCLICVYIIQKLRSSMIEVSRNCLTNMKLIKFRFSLFLKFHIFSFKHIGMKIYTINN